MYAYVDLPIPFPIARDAVLPKVRQVTLWTLVQTALPSLMDAAWSTRASVSGEGRGGASAVGMEGKGRCLSGGEGGEGEVPQWWGGRGRISKR